LIYIQPVIISLEKVWLSYLVKKQEFFLTTEGFSIMAYATISKLVYLLILINLICLINLQFS